MMTPDELWDIIESRFKNYSVIQKCKTISHIDSSIDIDDIKSDIYIKFLNKIDMFDDKKMAYIIVAIDNSITDIFNKITNGRRWKPFRNIDNILGSDVDHFFDFMGFSDNQRRLFLCVSGVVSLKRVGLNDVYRRGSWQLNSKYRDDVTEIINSMVDVFDISLDDRNFAILSMLNELRLNHRTKLERYLIVDDLFGSDRKLKFNSVIKAQSELFNHIVEFLTSKKIIKLRPIRRK